jgi:hypothetical protein
MSDLSTGSWAAAIHFIPVPLRGRALGEGQVSNVRNRVRIDEKTCTYTPMSFYSNSQSV